VTPLAAFSALPVLVLALAGNCASAEFELPAPGTASSGVAGLDAFKCETGPRVTLCRLEPGAARTFAGVAIDGATLEFRDGRVAVATVDFGESGFEAVTGRLAAAFGPGEDHGERLRGGMGGTFTNAVTAWRRDGAIWLAEQFAGRIDRSAVSRMDSAAFDALQAARAARRVNGARDL
jgi:hypothetical protein